MTVDEIDALCERLNARCHWYEASEPTYSDSRPCDCELPGYFYSGLPGVIARVENGKLVPGASVERCDQCCRFPSYDAALEKLRELGIACN